MHVHMGGQRAALSVCLAYLLNTSHLEVNRRCCMPECMFPSVLQRRVRTETAKRVCPWTTGETRWTQRKRAKQRSSRSLHMAPDVRRGASRSRLAPGAWGRALGRRG